MGRVRVFNGISLISIFFLVILSGNPITGAEQTPETPLILFLHSYHPTYIWTNDITDGFLEALGNTAIERRIAIEYLDWKYYQTNKSLVLQEQLIRYKYMNRPVSLIVTSDDAALDFILKRRNYLFPDVPVVFTGLNGYEDLHPYTYANVTGIVSSINPEATLQAMISMFPDTRDIWIVSEDTESGREISRVIHDATKKIPSGITYHDVGNITTHELYDQMKKLPPFSLILIGHWSRDATGEVADISEFAEKLSEISQVPIFNLYDFNIGKGTIGGSILSGRQQGVLAGRMVLEILNGTPADSIPVNLNDSTSYIFDAQVLKKFNIPQESLPPGSTLINKDKNILEMYFREVISTAIIFIILIISLVMLLYLMHQRRKTEKLLNIFINTLPGYVFFKDKQGRYQIANQQLLDTTGFSFRELIGKTDMDLFPLELAQKYIKNDQTVINSKESLYITEEEVEVKPGTRIPHSTRKVAVTGDHGEILGVIGLSVDISEQKAAKQEVEESRQKYYSLFELGQEAIFLIEDESGSILEANTAASEMYGYSHDELLTMKISDFVIDPAEERIIRKNSGELFTIPIINHVQKGGSSFQVEIVGRYFEWHEKLVFVAAIRDITERIRNQKALQKATEKINLFNFITRTGMNNQLFILNGYLDFVSDMIDSPKAEEFIDQSRSAVRVINRLVLFMKNYQDLGLKPAVWQRVEEVFIYAISHVNMSGIIREIEVEKLFIYADPFLEKVFQHLVENSQIHGDHVTMVRIRAEPDGDDLLLIYEDNGNGIAPDLKEQVFSSILEGKPGIGLILVREILAITGISITETGEFGTGARFEMKIPKGGFRYE
ncbi:MAG: PAS domain S-box protein [Methanomicrobiales archaeon]|nr:PAS domain S-box protein [Methanomicrobiales archaeon]